MMRDRIKQDLRGRADRLPLFPGLVDKGLRFDIERLRLFDDRMCLVEKIDQRPGRWQ